MSAGHATRTLSPLPESPSSARDFVRAVLTHWGLTGIADSALLVVTELTTNVVLHARTEYDVVLERRGSGVRVTVLDDSLAGPQRRRLGLRASTGRGLNLVDALSSDWGRTEARSLGGRAKGVWADVPSGADELSEGAMYGEDWLALLDAP